jgi:EAL domain-containing protein (putative c-di-GMP-specific phosphodiesterase class I)
MEQFAAFFQPVVTARTRRLAGVEVFARWHHPLHGIVQPLAFVPVLERAGLIHLLTERITAQTAMAQAQLRDLGIDITAVINLPLASLQDYDVVHKSCEIVDQYAVPAHSISFQIIEDAGICQRNQTLETLARLRLHGFGLVLDGFGTGQSSLQVLDSLPASTLNIDAAYIGDIHANSMHRQLVKSIVDIGRHINAAVVAKGVESARQCHYLAHIGCNLVQGNHIDSPMPLQLLLERYRSSIEALPHGAFSPGQHLHLVPTQAMP